MIEHTELSRAQLAMLDERSLRVLRNTTRRLADETQRQASRYQRSSNDINREMKRRRRAAKVAV